MRVDVLGSLVIVSVHIRHGGSSYGWSESILWGSILHIQLEILKREQRAERGRQSKVGRMRVLLIRGKGHFYTRRPMSSDLS
jgi:hypothetical protein